VASHYPNLRTTILRAFARTVADESRREDQPQASSSAPSSASEVVGLPAEGELVGEHYRLVRLLGQGMFGKVYVAQRVDVPEHQVALKLLPRSLYVGRNVDRELVMLATVGHPHVVQLKDHGTTSEYVWLTMPVYQGETLAERLERRPLGLREAYDIFLPIARGLEALHSAGLRHQDVKPENIYLAVFGGRVHPIILDLGVAAEKDATFVAGTALYAAPEQVAALSGAEPGAILLCEKMDTYGLASTLLVALVGPALFPGEAARDRAQLAEAHTTRARNPFHPDALPDLTGPPRELIAGAFSRWLALDPAERPSMREFAEHLEVLLEPEREEHRSEERRRARQRSTIQRFKVALGAMVLIGLAGMIVMYSKRRTLELASKLEEAKEQARREGARSFDQLETCNASYRMATMEATACHAARDKTRGEFNQALEEIKRSGSTPQGDYARQMQVYTGRIKTCEDAMTASQRTCTEEQLRLADMIAKQKAAFEKEREELKAQAQAAKPQAATALQERDQCIAERNACTEERDACRAAAKAGSGSGPAASGSPSTGGRPAPSVIPSGGAVPAVSVREAGAPAPSVAHPPSPPPPKP
jgi:serine/threonine protein kinase